MLAGLPIPAERDRAQKLPLGLLVASELGV
jgi:hypothetical protein